MCQAEMSSYEKILLWWINPRKEFNPNIAARPVTDNKANFWFNSLKTELIFGEAN